MDAMFDNAVHESGFEHITKVLQCSWLQVGPVAAEQGVEDAVPVIGCRHGDSGRS